MEEWKQQYAKASALFLQGKYLPALDILNDLVIQVPKNPDVQFARVLCLKALGRFDEALFRLDKLLASHQYQPAADLRPELATALNACPVPCDRASSEEQDSEAVSLSARALLEQAEVEGEADNPLQLPPRFLLIFGAVVLPLGFLFLPVAINEHHDGFNMALGGAIFIISLGIISTSFGFFAWLKKRVRHTGPMYIICAVQVFIGCGYIHVIFWSFFYVMALADPPNLLTRIGSFYVPIGAGLAAIAGIPILLAQSKSLPQRVWFIPSAIAAYCADCLLLLLIIAALAGVPFAFGLFAGDSPGPIEEASMWYWITKTRGVALLVCLLPLLLAVAAPIVVPIIALTLVSSITEAAIHVAAEVPEEESFWKDLTAIYSISNEADKRSLEDYVRLLRWSSYNQVVKSRSEEFLTLKVPSLNPW